MVGALDALGITMTSRRLLRTRTVCLQEQGHDHSSLKARTNPCKLVQGAVDCIVPRTPRPDCSVAAFLRDAETLKERRS